MPENLQWKRELARAIEERDIPKEPPRISLGMQTRYAFITEHRDRFGEPAMCLCLSVQRSGYYAQQKIPLSLGAQEDARQTELRPRGLEGQRQGLCYSSR